MACDGIPNDYRGSELWRTGRHDAARRGTICLPPRSAGAIMGISLWLDFVPGNSDGDDCGSRSCLWKVPRRLLSFNFLHTLAHSCLESTSDSYWIDGPRQHGRWAEHAEPDGCPDGHCALDHQYLWREDRGDHSEHIYLRESCRIAGSRPRRFVCR